MHDSTRFWTAAMVLSLSAGAGAGDLLTLKDGRTLDGEYVGGSRTAVHFRVGSRIEHFPLDEVRSLGFDPAREPLVLVVPPAEPASDVLIVPAGDGISALEIQRLPSSAQQRSLD